jgi:selenocysteine lyase/cysteine desulfurase
VEYPANVYPWVHLRSRGVVLRAIAARRGGVEPDQVAEVMGPRTRLVAVSSVQFASGHVTDLAAVGQLCARAGALLCVDGIQSVGCVPTDVKRLGIHFLSADSHKWMLGLSGCGFLFVDRAVQARLRPPLVGWKSLVDAWNFDRNLGTRGAAPASGRIDLELRGDASRFEEGSPNYASIAGMGAGVDLLLEVGMERVAEEIAVRLQILDRGLRALGCDVSPPAGERAGILTFVPPRGNAATLLDALAARGVSATLRRGRIRLSPHFVNTDQQMHRLVDLVAELTGLDDPAAVRHRPPDR